MTDKPISRVRAQLPAVPGHDLTRMSGIVRFSLHALDRFESRPGFRVSMDHWHSKGVNSRVPYAHPDYNKPFCYACLGGATVLELAGVDSPDHAFWSSTDRTHELMRLGQWAGVGSSDVATLERALDAVREGDVLRAMDFLGVDPAGWIEDWRSGVTIADYHFHPALFKENLLQLAADLEKLGY